MVQEAIGTSYALNGEEGCCHNRSRPLSNGHSMSGAGVFKVSSDRRPKRPFVVSLVPGFLENDFACMVLRACSVATRKHLCTVSGQKPQSWQERHSKKWSLCSVTENQGIKTVVCGRKTAFLKSRPDKLSYTAVSRHTPATVTNTMSLHNKSAK